MNILQKIFVEMNDLLNKIQNVQNNLLPLLITDLNFQTQHSKYSKYIFQAVDSLLLMYFSLANTHNRTKGEYLTSTIPTIITIELTRIYFLRQIVEYQILLNRPGENQTVSDSSIKQYWEGLNHLNRGALQLPVEILANDAHDILQQTKDDEERLKGQALDLLAGLLNEQICLYN